ncbi:hypothetical protein ABPG72_002465 [Tetrahymena utriculariae]
MYAIKNIPTRNMSENEKIKRQNEYNILHKLNHPNVIQLIEATDCSYTEMIQIIMEYADDGDLKQKIEKQKKEKKTFSEDQILNWFAQICLGLQYLQSENIIHRDIKSANIFLNKCKNCCKIGDFGYSKELQYTNQQTSSRIGSNCYIAPEIILGQTYSYQVDIWSLGIILYELCCLELPFQCWQEACHNLQITEQYYPAIQNTEYSQNLKNLISQLLIKDPNKRYTLQHIFDKPFIQKRLIKFLEEAESKSKSIPLQITRKKNTNINQFRTQLRQTPIRKQGYQHYCFLQENNKANYQQPNKQNIIKQIYNSTNTKNQNLQNNQQNAQRQVQEEQKNEIVENEKRNLIQFGQNQQQNIVGVKLPIVCQRRSLKVNQNRNLFIQQSTNQNTESTPFLKKQSFKQIEQQDQIRKCNPSPKPIIKNSQKHLEFHDLNKVGIINQNIQNQANNQIQITKSIKQLEPLNTQTSTYLSRRNTGYSIQDMDKTTLCKKMDPQTTISTHDKKFPTRRSNQQKHRYILTQRKLQDKNDQDTINIPSSNQQLKKDQELNEQEKKISHFNQEHKKESTNQNNQNLQTQIQKEEVNELTNNDSYQTTQKIKNTYSEKQETIDNPQNLQEQKNNEDPNYLGTPGGDQLFATNKFNAALAEQNKIAGLQYRVDDAQEKIISHFKQEHKRESTNQNSQNIQKQIQKEEANEFINNNSYQTTQKIKETSLEKQETIDNPQNIQEQNNNENPNYLGTPGGDQLFAANKLNSILAEQNKIADFQYRVDVAQQDETQNKQIKENLVENQQSVQNDIECQKQKDFILPKEYSQFTKIYAKVISKTKNLGNTEKQNTLNEINKKQNLKQTDQVPTSPTKISNYSDKKDFTTKIKDNSDQQQNISSAKKNMSFELQQDSASCKFFTDKKNIQRNQTESSSQQKTCKEQLNEKNEGKKKIRKISFESGQKEIEQTHQSKQSPQKPSFFDRKQQNNQTVGQVNQLSQQYLINSQESPRSNQHQKQFGEQSQQKKYKLCNSSFKGVQENIYDENEQQSDEESFLKISTELDQNQTDSDQSIYISQLKSLIKTGPTQGQDIIQNNGTNEFTFSYLSDGIDKNCEFDQNQSYQEEKEEQQEEKQEKQHEDLDSEEESNIYLVANQKSDYFYEQKFSLKQDMTQEQFELFCNTVKSEIKKSDFQNKTLRDQINILQQKIPQIQLDKFTLKIQQFINIVKIENDDVEIEYF